MRFKERRPGADRRRRPRVGADLETPHRGGGESLAHAPAGLLQIGKTDSDRFLKAMLQRLMLIVFTAGQYRPGDASQLVGDSHNDLVAWSTLR